MCSVLISEQTVTFSLYNINRLDFMAEVESVHCAVQTDSLCNTDTSSFKRIKKADVAVSTAEATQNRQLLIPYNNLQQQNKQEEILLWK
jgi:hypothetical protein